MSLIDVNSPQTVNKQRANYRLALTAQIPLPSYEGNKTSAHPAGRSLIYYYQCTLALDATEYRAKVNTEKRANGAVTVA